MVSIDLNSPVPKYYQLKEIVRGMIEKEELREGQLVPSERELCERYGISRMTVRQAVMDLVNEGVLYREQGRGTFVGKKFQQEGARLSSFTQDMSDRGMKASSEVLGVEVGEADPDVAGMLGVDPGEKIVRVERVRDADGEPMALERSHLLFEVGEGVIGVDLSTHSLYDELRKTGLRIAGAKQSYEAVLVNDFESGHLGVPAGSPALLVERVTFDAEDRPFEYVKSVYRADRYRVTTTLRA